MNLDSDLIHPPSTNEGQQSETPVCEAAPTAKPRARHDSVARKRTNDEVYGPVQTPVSSPRSIRFDKSVMSGGPPDPVSQHSDGTVVSGQLIQAPLAEEEHEASQKKAAEPSPSDQPSDSFVQDIKDYQQQLELEFQTFERSLEERDTSTDLEALDWQALEARYKTEIQPHIDSEQEIMTEFGSRFQVSERHREGCLTVSN